MAETESVADSSEPIPQNAAKPVSILLETGNYSDLTLKCGDRRWKVHKSVVCLQSEFFSSSCDKDFKEARLNLIDLSEDDEDALASMIRFMYHSDYDYISTTDDTGESYEMLHHVRVFTLAQKYLIGALQDLARDRAISAMSSWDTLVFAETTREIFTCTSDYLGGSALRAAALTMVVQHVSTLLPRDCSDDKYMQMRAIFEEIPDFMNLVITEQSTLITNLQCVSQLLNQDNSQLNATTTNFGANLNDRFPRAPTGSPGAGDQPMKYYKCPNCATVFVRSMRPHQNWTHNCYSPGLLGALGGNRQTFTSAGWDAHVVAR